ncbi:hypothetical protein BRADI_3g30183v3 [Brachypodium distachyon]|uniref:Reverse transcriptase zinc-binding domain-containing protein n=1 Tax=Brachypodium distachyon TaxID=15368 RepID=A0A0Q3JGG1_BRADI|nr:hypothetical protein BRADI_3g30183v3 [Brachypodium distachyon]
MESAMHVFLSYCFAGQVWRLISIWSGISIFDPFSWSTADSIESWWTDRIVAANQTLSKFVSRGANSFFLLSLWSIWKERNNRIFKAKSSPAAGVVMVIRSEAALWR